ncbi:hypothetical protein DLD77_10790 [Chitinophaga alhagiae]|uniref:DUF4476 domain-containing protein n=1 Tax=Chitinophaga alhagiae TaxID=2203219 RepID=A0ABM6WDP4_9BACT|nr:DUF4476 domain-containing protein [Chitinophaga alhagiae]AWO02144.1 hypothetical protein DLD77_10790 [Chitinophaga alhagiae]
MDRIKLKLLYLCCCLLVATGLAAQDASYFVYIQHEKQQPFYVKLNGKLLSSSTRGYVILPRLQAGKVPVTIGFPKSEAPEQHYVIRLTGKRDYGFLLKGNGDKDYALYDLQTFASLKSAGGAVEEEAPEEGTASVTVARISSDTATPEQKAMMDNVQADVEAALHKSADTGPRKKSSFAEALDKVVIDDRPEDMPLEAPKPTPKPAAPPVETVPVATITDDATEAPAKKPARGKRNRSREREPLTAEEKELLSSVLEDEKKAAADEALAEAAAEKPAVVEETGPPPVKKEKKPKKKKEGPEPEFIDFGESGAAPAAAKAAETVVETAPVIADGEEKPEVSAKEAREARRLKRKAEREAADREALLKDSLANAEFYGDTEIGAKAKKEEKEKKPAIAMVNSDCGKVLEVDAFRKLLRTMNSKKKDEDMVDAFRRSVRSVCVSTEQIRALTQLISTEDNRYQLLDAAYPRTYDSQNYADLEDLLKDDYYKGRFKALIKR